MRSWRTLAKSSVVLCLTAATAASAADATKFDRDFLERNVPAYPHHDCPSLLFYNLVEIYKIPGFLRYVTDAFAGEIRRLNPDYIAAPEARAWPALGAVALVTDKPSLLIRKAGKLPKNAPLISTAYRTAYADNAMEMTVDPALRGKTAVLLDDGLSSAGTTLAAIDLLERQGVTVLGVIVMIEYHYKPRLPAYAPWYPKTFSLFDLAKPKPIGTAIEAFETERKFLVPKLAGFPEPVRLALLRGESHPWVKNRGLVLQEYLPLAQLKPVIDALASEDIPFGTPEEQAAVIPTAQEVRLSTKSIQVRVGETDEIRNVTQITVKGPGGLSVRQLETPNGLSAEQQAKLAAIVERFRPLAMHRLRKVSFETSLVGLDEQVRRRTDGSEYTAEIDIYVGGEGDARFVRFANAEVEFHGATLEASIAEGKAFQPMGRFFGNDLTAASGVKARDIAAAAVPTIWAESLRQNQSHNDAALRALLGQFEAWADPVLVARMKR